MINPIRPYSRLEIDKEFQKVKRLMHKKALKKGYKIDGKKTAYYKDVYTGLIFRGGDRYDYEHIRSSENLHTKFKATHTDKEIALIVNHLDNVGVTDRDLNNYKDKYPIESRILNDPTKLLKYKINKKLAEKNIKKADKSIAKIAAELVKNRV